MIYTNEDYLNMKTPLSYQISEYDCGTTSLLNAINYLFKRGEIKPEWIKCIYDNTLDNENGYKGTSNDAIEKVAQCLNEYSKIEAICLTGEEANIDNGILRKVILEGGVALLRVFDDYEHYVICTKIQDEKAYIFDPYYCNPDDFEDDELVIMDVNHPYEYNRIVDLSRLREETTSTYAMVHSDIVNVMLLRRSTSKKKMILFDMDGTLWDTLETTCQNANEFLKEMNIEGHEITLETVRKTMGCNHKDAAFNYFPFLDEETRDEYLTMCSARNAKTLAKVGGILYPKLEETLKILSEKYMLAIVSNCSGPYLEAFVTSSKLDYIFVDEVAAGKEKLSKADAITMVLNKHKIKKEEAIYVGDTIRDYDAATEAGIDCIYCRYGFGEIPNAKYIVDKFEELPKVMEEI